MKEKKELNEGWRRKNEGRRDRKKKTDEWTNEEGSVKAD